MYVQLTERQQKVLRATVNHYIETAEPVGSQALAKEYEFSLSSATIRNVMGMLEKEGLLYQPHTSAGRIPSDSGYRVYVDKLITPSDQWVERIQQLLAKRLSSENTSFETLLRQAAQILATLSGCVALITVPQSSLATTIRHLHLVQVEPQRVMLILVTDTYETRSVFMDLPAHLGQSEDAELLEQELHLLSNFLNHHLCGKSLSELALIDWQALDREFQKFAAFLKQLCQDLSQRNQSPIANPILIGGVSEFLRQPEFSELAQAQTIIQMLEEEQDQLWPLIYEGIEFKVPSSKKGSRPPVLIRIGTENALKPIQNCALVSSVYQKGTTPVGSVGVLGPTRMAYDKVIAFVEGTAEFLTARLGQVS